MQEVFEKIIEKLNSKKAYFQRFYECEGKSEHDADLNKSTQLAFDDAIEIVKQEAEKFGRDTNVGSNGWIPVSERLPEEYEDVEVTIEEIADDVGGKRYYNVRSWLQDGQWVIKKNPYKPTVIAWKYPTEPYQPKGE